MNYALFFKNNSFYNEWSVFFMKKRDFFKNGSFYDELCSLFQKPQFLQWIIHCVAGSRSETFLAPGGVNGGAKPSRAEPGGGQGGQGGLQAALTWSFMW